MRMSRSCRAFGRCARTSLPTTPRTLLSSRDWARHSSLATSDSRQRQARARRSSSSELLGFPMRPSRLASLLFLVLAARAHAQRVHTHMPSPSTVAFGYYDAAAAPVLRVRSGDEVIVGTIITSSPNRLEQVGVKPND